MKWLTRILAVMLIALGVGFYLDHRAHESANTRLADENASLRTAKAELIAELNATHTKFADADLKRQFAEDSLERWRLAVAPYYIRAMVTWGHPPIAMAVKEGFVTVAGGRKIPISPVDLSAVLKANR